MDVDSVEIEELDESQVPESELAQFEETEPIRYDRIEPEAQLNEKEEEILLKKFINGEVEFPEYYTRPVPDDEDYVTHGEEPEPSTSAAFQVEFMTSARESLKGNFQGSSTGRVRRKHPMNSVLQSLMGQANLCFARGQNDIAEKLCLEVIRQNPLVPGPYLTLAQIYENTDPTKFLQFATVSAHLSTTDREQWIRLAEIHIERKNYEQARNSYTNALKYCKQDYDLRLRKAELLEMMNEEKKAIACYYKALEVMPPEKADVCLELARKVSKYYYKNGRHKDSMQAMRYAFILAPKLFTTEDINMFLEFLIMSEEYVYALKVLNETTNVDVAVEKIDDEITVGSCEIPDDLLPEFRVKLVVVLIHLKAHHLLDYVLNNIHEFIAPEDGIDLYVDITEELIKEQRFQEVITFLKPLIESNNFDSPPYVWLCYADCFRALQKTAEAIQSYYTVIEAAPNCFDARLTLSALLKQEGKCAEALKVLEQDIDCDPIAPRLLYERCLMLRSVGDLEQYMNVGYLMLLRNSIKFKSRDELMLAAVAGNRCRREFIKNILASRRELTGVELDEGPEYIESNGNLTTEDEYELYKDLMHTAYTLRKFGTMEKFAFTALISPTFRQKHSEMETTILYSSIFNDDPKVAFEYLRSQIVKNLNNNSYWNLYSLILQKGDDIRYRRFAKRLQDRQVNQPLLRIIAANYYLYTGSYKYALNDYMSVMRKISDPLISLGISATLNQLSGQKNISKRPTAQMHAAMFMKKYANERMSPHTEQEICYNMGRLYHSVGLLHTAVHYYEKGLAIVKSEMVKENINILSLSREIAFNLHLIYKSSGNMVMARKVIKDYIVV